MDSTDEEKLQACKAMLEADGDRDMAIILAKRDGWWKKPNQESYMDGLGSDSESLSTKRALLYNNDSTKPEEYHSRKQIN